MTAQSPQSPATAGSGVFGGPRTRDALSECSRGAPDSSSPGPWETTFPGNSKPATKLNGCFAALQSSPSGSRPVSLLSREVNQGVPPPAAAGLEAKEVDKPQTPGSLSARLALAAGMGGKGFKSIADIAKPAMKTSAGKKLVGASPLDSCLLNSARTREESKRAMAEGEINLTKMYARDHDGMVTARALLVGSTKSLTRMVAAAEALEVEAAKARAQMQADQEALNHAKSFSIKQLTAERNALIRTMCNEIRAIETDKHFSLTTLLDKYRRTEGNMYSLGEKLNDQIGNLDSTLSETREQHSAYASAAEKKETRLSQEIARLCGVVDKLKADMAQQKAEHDQMHADVVKTMSNQLMDKQRTIDERDMEIRELHAKLEGTTASMTNQLRDLAREKELREQRLKEENAQAIERSRRANAEFTNKLTNLQAEKEAQEKQLAEELRQTQAESQKKADGLAMKIEKMRKLQELALGGVGGGSSPLDTSGGASPRERKGPSSRGRQLLYWESLKSKTQEQGSMSWRGADEFAHEQPSSAR